jgi:RNA polymerase-binding protein DksA
MPDQSCLAAVLGGPEHCRLSGPREVAAEVVNYDVCMAGPARHHRSAFALYLPQSRNEGLIMPKTEEHHAATTADILARGPDTPNIDPRWQKHFDRLNRLRESIAQQRSTQLADATVTQPFTVNPADRGTDEYDMGAALSLISSEQNALYEIDQALRRIRDGTYGMCEATGKPIPEDRLNAVPWTRFTLEIEEQLEREQQARKPKHVL